ncbi:MULTISPECIES: nucleotide sugar dehydrogenase [Spirulina sp. CCY15215]|uniref:nucleotide sugar dehydrogenase n=1 Tax=Spirulina sp. CCY15215 TaxID=2767591 RepID=UPI00194EE249|nr:nucleotide sugar dehydrogenase [Spirulina major]
MKVIVWGLDYIGTTIAACLADLGHNVIAIDKTPSKIKAINHQKSPIQEPGLGEMVKKAVQSGHLWGRVEGREDVKDADISLICAETPINRKGQPILKYVEGMTAEISQGLQESENYHVIILQSAVLPGIARNILIPLLEKYSHKKVGRDFGVAVNPQFLRETTAIADFFAPPYIIIGEEDSRSGNILERLYRDIPAQIHRTDIETAEALKMSANAFETLKISFANEMGRFCDRLNINGDEVMDLLWQNNQFSAPLQPGFAFGGSSLEKNLRSLISQSEECNVNLPILNAILPSNGEQITSVVEKVRQLRVKKVTVLGLTNKPKMHNLQETPVIPLLKQLWQENIELRVFDPDIHLNKLIGNNRDYITRNFPQLGTVYARSLDEAIFESELVIIVQNRPIFHATAKALPNAVKIIDLTHQNNLQSQQKIQHFHDPYSTDAA